MIDPGEIITFFVALRPHTAEIRFIHGSVFRGQFLWFSGTIGGGKD